MDFTTVLSNMGFPIACAAYMGYFINGLVNRINDDFKSREERLLDNNAKLAEALNRSSETHKLIFDRMDLIDSKLHDVDTKVSSLVVQK